MAAYPNENSSTFIPFYHAPKDSDKTTQTLCNREHTWPKSRGGSLIETDPLVIRPTLTSDNSARGNNFYGNEKGNEWDPASCGYEVARGESARIILYAAARYSAKGLSLSSNPGDSTGLKTMGTLKTLLKWNLQYLPTEFEKTVNDRYAAAGYARNPFIDHPEYANFIWDDNGMRTTPYQTGAVVSQTSSQSASSSVTSSSATEVPNEGIVLLPNQFPTSYPNSPTVKNISGLDLTIYYVGYFEQSIQLKSREGYLYNMTSLGGFTKLTITLASNTSASPSVKLGTQQNPTAVATPIITDNVYVYDISTSPFFRIDAGSGVTRLGSIQIQ